MHGGSQMIWLKGAAVAFVVAAIFLAGYWFAAQGYKREIADMMADYERRSKAAQEEANAKLLSEREKNAQVTSELVARLEDLSVRGRESAVRADRLQRELAARAKVSASDSSTCKSCEQRFARCARLLSEGVGLAGEGSELAERIAIRKDALAKLMNVKNGDF